MQLFAQIFDLAANICYWSGGEDELNKFKKNIKIKMLHVERKKIIYKKF